MAWWNRDPNSGTNTPQMNTTLRSIQLELHAEIEKKNDDANQVLRILEKHRFDELSESAKFELLCVDCTHRIEHIGYINLNILRDVVKGDNIRIMPALLPKIPISYILSGEANPGESCKAAPEILLRNKGRWNVRKCECKSHAAPSTEAEEVCSLEKRASVVLAARLFYESCESQSGRCMLYLLAVCPELLSPELLSIEGSAFYLALALCTFPALREVFLDKQMMQYLRHRIGDILANLIVMANASRVKRKYLYVFTTIAAKLFKEEILQYRDRKGRSLLHKVCSLRDWECEYILCYIEHLMRLGFDPAVTDCAGRTPLDALFRDVYQPYLPYPSNSDTERNQHIVQLFLLYAHTMLPYCKDEAIKNLALSRPSFQQSPNYEENFFNVCRVFIDVNIFPHSTKKHLLGLILNGHLRPERASMLLHREMCKGLNMTRPCFRMYGAHRRFIERLLEVMRKFFFTSDRRLLQASIWNALELIVHSTASIGNVHHRRLIDLMQQDYHGPLFLLDFLLDLGNVRGVVKMLWMYVPSSKADVITFLQKLSTHPDANTRDTATELLSVVRSVPTLQTLCRISIVRRLKYVDIPKLGLANRIQQYLQLGDMSDDHPMRIADNIVDAQQI